MIAVDSNLLIYSHREDAEFHTAAKDVIGSLRHNPSPWAIPWPCIHEFVGIVTHPKIFRPASTLAQAFAAVDAWLAGGNLQLLAESAGYYEKLRTLSESAGLSGPRIHDARIAALCVHHGVRELWSADRDFLAFPQIKVRNPLIEESK